VERSRVSIQETSVRPRYDDRLVGSAALREVQARASMPRLLSGLGGGSTG